jgi:hypothetical protein
MSAGRGAQATRQPEVDASLDTPFLLVLPSGGLLLLDMSPN